MQNKNDYLNLHQRIQKPFLDSLSKRINRAVENYLDKNFRPGMFAVSMLNAANSCGTQLMKVLPIGEFKHLNNFVDNMELWKKSVGLLRKSYFKREISRNEFADGLAAIQYQILTYFKIKIPSNNTIAA